MNSHDYESPMKYPTNISWNSWKIQKKIPGKISLPGLVNVYSLRTGKIHLAIFMEKSKRTFDWAMASSSLKLLVSHYQRVNPHIFLG